MEFTLLAAALTGVAALWIALRLTGQGRHLDLVITALLVGLLSGRLVAMVVAGVNPLTNPLDVILVRGGVDPAGATVGALAYLVWQSRSQVARLSALAPAAVVGMAGWHAGCLWRGSCLGVAGEVPWGWSLAGSEMIRHPVELYAAALMAAAAVALSRIPGEERGRAGLALAAVAAARLLTEPLRPTLGTGPSWWYAAGVAIGLAWAMLDRTSGHRPTPLRA